MKHPHRRLAAFAATSILLVAGSSSAFAAEEDFSFTVVDNLDPDLVETGMGCTDPYSGNRPAGVIITGYSGTRPIDLVIPEEIEGAAVIGLVSFDGTQPFAGWDSEEGGPPSLRASTTPIQFVARETFREI